MSYPGRDSAIPSHEVRYIIWLFFPFIPSNNLVCRDPEHNPSNYKLGNHLASNPWYIVLLITRKLELQRMLKLAYDRQLACLSGWGCYVGLQGANFSHVGQHPRVQRRGAAWSASPVINTPGVNKHNTTLSTPATAHTCRFPPCCPRYIVQESYPAFLNWSPTVYKYLWLYFEYGREFMRMKLKRAEKEPFINGNI